MEKTGRGVRICLFAVVFIAIILGIICYFIEVENQLMSGEGTLVSNIGNDWCLIWE